MDRMSWICCKCTAGNVSPDYYYLKCHNSKCSHHLCPSCFHPKAPASGPANVNVNVNINFNHAHTKAMDKKVVSDTHFDDHKIKHMATGFVKKAKKLVGKVIRHSTIGKFVLSAWSFFHSSK